MFNQSALVSKYLDAALKTYSFTCPKIINIENQQMSDTHVVKLCNFLQDKRMVKTLNLRKNLITEVGV